MSFISRHVKKILDGRKQPYITARDARKLDTYPKRARLRLEKAGDGKRDFAWLEVEIKMPDGKWYEVAYTTLIHPITTGISYTMGDQEGGGGTFPLPTFQHCHGVYTAGKILYILHRISDG